LSGSDRASSGLAGLDDILGGGFVLGRLHLVEGRPGTGKTTLGMHFVLAGRDRGEKVLFVSMSETLNELQAVAAAHGWSLDGIEICQLMPPESAEGDDNRQTMFRPSEVELGETMRLLCGEIERIDPALIVLDSLSEMRLLAQNPLRYRRQIFALKHFLARRYATVLVLDDMAMRELGVAPGRCLFVAGSAYDLFGTSKVGLPAYWHDRICMAPPRNAPEPIAHHRLLHPLLELVRPVE
jgi:circadian clock protein KaiC